MTLRERYIQISSAIENNTAEVMTVLAEGNPSSEEFRTLWRERDELYGQWKEMMNNLQHLPTNEISLIFNYIEQA